MHILNDNHISKEGQEMLRGMQRISVRKVVEPDPPPRSVEVRTGAYCHSPDRCDVHLKFEEPST
jgi:hypothetical protein